MDSGNNEFNPSTKNIIARKSWTAYMWSGFVVITLSIILGSVHPALIVLPAAFMVYKVIALRSYVLYTDDLGVWIFSGVFPWTKGSNGVKWRDLDEAVYFTGLTSWLFKSYTIRISHRFTKDSEIVLNHMAHGHEATQTINKQHGEVIDLKAA